MGFLFYLIIVFEWTSQLPVLSLVSLCFETYQIALGLGEEER